MSRIVYVNGAFVPEESAVISVFDRGFIFGDGIYEVVTVIGGKLVDSKAHLARLRRSAQEIDLPLIWSDADIIAIHHELVARNAMNEGTVYLQVTRGAADRDFAPPPAMTPSLVMFTQARPVVETAVSGTGMKVATFPDLRWERRDIKSVNLLAPVLARQFARAAGAHEAWLVEGEVVTEGATSTAWIVKGKTLISRALSHKVLPGITRQSVLTLLASSDLRLEERTFTVSEAFDADEAFATSAGHLVQAIISVDDHPIGNAKPGPIATKLRQIYLEMAANGGPLGS